MLQSRTEIFRWQTVVHRKKIIFKYYFGNYCENYQAHKHLRIRVPKTPWFLLRHLATDNVAATRVLQSPTRNSCGCCDLPWKYCAQMNVLQRILPVSCLPLLLCRVIFMCGLTSRSSVLIMYQWNKVTLAWEGITNEPVLLLHLTRVDDAMC